MRRRGLAVTGLLAAACHTTLTGYPFSTRAVYEAPLSGYRFEALTEGRVPAGADLADAGSGVVRVCPIPRSSAAPVTLTFPPGAASVSISVGGPSPTTVTAPWTATGAVAALGVHLAGAGFTGVDSTELGETVRAIDGALSGPKGTLLAGQTRALTVRSMRLSREAPKAPAAPSPCGSF